MAKPFGEGLKYFRLYTNILENYKMELMEDHHGDAGYTFVVKMWTYIFSKGYFIELDEPTIEKLCKKVVKKSSVEFDILLRSAIEFKIFDKKLYKNYNILTSGGVQENYLDIAKRWKRIKIIQDYLVPTVDIDDCHIFLCDRDNRIIHEKNKKEIPVARFSVKKSPTINKPLNGIHPSTEFLNPPSFINSKIPYDEIKVFCEFDYDKQNTKFKQHITSDWFISFVNFNQFIDQDYPQIRISEYQLNIDKYKKLLTEPIDGKVTDEKELKEAVIKLAGNGVKENFTIYLKLIDYIKYVRENKAKHITKNKADARSKSRSGYTPDSYD